MGSDATALQELAETMLSDAATVSPAESEISTVAYRLWLDNGCPVGSDQEDWLRAEAMLRNALAAGREHLAGRPSIPRYVACTDSEMLVEFRWEGQIGRAHV